MLELDYKGRVIFDCREVKLTCNTADKEQVSEDDKVVL